MHLFMFENKHQHFHAACFLWCICHVFFHRKIRYFLKCLILSSWNSHHDARSIEVKRCPTRSFVVSWGSKPSWKHFPCLQATFTALRTKFNTFLVHTAFVPCLQRFRTVKLSIFLKCLIMSLWNFHHSNPTMDVKSRPTGLLVVNLYINDYMENHQ